MGWQTLGGPAAVTLYRLEPNCEWESKKSIDPAQQGTKVSRDKALIDDKITHQKSHTELPTYKVTPTATSTDSPILKYLTKKCGRDNVPEKIIYVE